MQSKLLAPYEIREMTFKNRVVMSPMCMYAVEKKDGIVTDFHFTHYGSRAVGQVGLIMLEATAVLPEGRISEQDLGIWSDDQIAGLKKLVAHLHKSGAKVGIQLAHAGRKAQVPGPIYSATKLAFSEKYQTPEALTIPQIETVVSAFQKAVKRAEAAGFDVIEIHAAHGYLVNQFLSPLVNRREDQYGGPIGNRYQFLNEIIEAVRSEWTKPLFVRISAEDYAQEGVHLEDYLMMSRWLRDQGVDLIDVSTGGVIPLEAYDVYPGYQVQYADRIRKKVGIATGAVGMITTGNQAEEILRNERADLVFIGRELLRDPYWVKTSAKLLNAEDQLEVPTPYQRGWR
ncbi:NADPH dehydrogenase NamA [Isobaculum melis]|uniref:NADPH2 dehydrogenase n=1 Tax=Isobaculum melis TaxID=142588 RepID=A0A1H9QIB9_9LACT|nr:NADPH dehydrogenase NamA [Isobaculum melis]SER60167.1 NADPH2 dehydrogenase [Isobaculum melis]